MSLAKIDRNYAVTLPDDVAANMGVAPGDVLEIEAAGPGRARITRVDATEAGDDADATRRQEFLKAIDGIRLPLASGYRFDRDEANAR
jgi:bifunctional DNA-binding transcriptional regulator/antitoxin component of YhaV-PrlF toxin-antitoxin module